MVDDNESEPQRSDGGATPRRPRSSRPFWRRGWFWVGVIVVEVAVVMVLSFAFERSTTEVDLAGADLTAFCTQARAVRAQNQQATEQATQGDDVGDPSAFEQERAAYLALAAIAPPALVADLERLAELDEELVAVVVEIGERKASDPSYDGLGELSAELERVSTKGRVAAARVDLVLREQCQIDEVTETTTTTAGLGPVPPGSSPP